MTILSYIIEVTIAWGLFFGIYLLFLQKETFFKANRIYLLSTTAIGLLLPFLQFEATETVFTSFSIEISTVINTIENQSTTRWWQNLENWLWVSYSVGIIFFTSRFLKGIYTVYKLLKTGKQAKYEGYTLVFSSEIKTPFSFVRYLFINEQLINHTKAHQQILQHELAHLKGKHSFDLLLTEVLCIIFWFIPFIHFYKNEIRTLHEYLADAAVLQSTSKQQYGDLLLQQTFNNYSFSFTNHFHSQLKKRIVMMTKQPSSTLAYWKYALVLPTLVLMLLTFSTSTSLAQSKDKKKITDVDQMPTFSGCESGDKHCSQQKLMKFLQENLKYPKEAKEKNLEGKVFVQFVVDKKGKIKDAKVIKGDASILGKAAVAIVNEMPNWNPGRKDGKSVAVEMVLPFNYALPKDKK